MFCHSPGRPKEQTENQLDWFKNVVEVSLKDTKKAQQPSPHQKPSCWGIPFKFHCCRGHMQGRGPNGGGGFEERQKVRVIMRKKKAWITSSGEWGYCWNRVYAVPCPRSEFFFGNLTLWEDSFQWEDVLMTLPILGLFFFLLSLLPFLPISLNHISSSTLGGSCSIDLAKWAMTIWGIMCVCGGVEICFDLFQVYFGETRE